MEQESYKSQLWPDVCKKCYDIAEKRNLPEAELMKDLHGNVHIMMGGRQLCKSGVKNG